MADNRHTQNRPVDLSDPAQRHEKRDVNVWVITRFGIGLVLTTIASLFIVLAVFHYLQVGENALPPPQPTGVNVDARRLPPEPRLLTNEPENLQEVRTAEDQILNNFSWADEKHTVVKLPIDRAVDLLVQRGLPSRAQNGAQSISTATVPAESGLGPIMQQPGGPLGKELAGSGAGK
jgi:hypothetical protein